MSTVALLLSFRFAGHKVASDSQAAAAQARAPSDGLGGAGFPMASLGFAPAAQQPAALAD